MNSIVLFAHTPESEESISGTTGDRLTFERRETVYPGWIWCTDVLGNRAWVPEAFVSVSGETCVLVRDYDSRELAVSEGEVVRILEKESGWAWVVDDLDRRGWVPLECLAL